MSLFLVQGRCPISQEPAPEFLAASRATLEHLVELRRGGVVVAGGVMIGPLGVAFVADCVDNEALHVLLTTLPSFRYADWEVMALLPFERDVELSLDDALRRASDTSPG